MASRRWRGVVVYYCSFQPTRAPDSLVDLCTGLFQIVAFAGFAEIGAMPAAQYTGGPQNLPGGYDGSVGTIPGGYPFTTQIEDVTARNRALTCELQNGRAAMLGTFGAMCHSCVDSCDHHFFYPITHN
jgi:hypothetical protein